MKNPITTPCGQIRGTEGRIPGVTAYKGIRYATAGRWEYPKQVTSWEGVYDATEYGHCSYQPRAFYNEEDNVKKNFYYNEFRRGESYTYSEDCLFLNIWTPSDATPESKLPVIIYIHGGGFVGGCGHEKHFDGPTWPTKGVIAVTLNYRLGPLGFCCLPELKAEAGHTGNYGLFDQLEAIKWVNNNIASFGGDPSRITIMGQSAGAMSVQTHCQSPLSEGLFSAAVMSSGCGLGGMLMSTTDKASVFWQELLKRSGLTLAELRALPIEDFFKLYDQTKKEVKGGFMSSVPVKDGVMVTKGAKPMKIPYIVGGNSHDIVPPILLSAARKWGKKEMLHSYSYLFDRMLPGDENGAWHSADLWYWFGTLPNSWRPMEQKDYEISDKMTTYLCNFAKNGDPNGSSQTAWSPTKENKKSLLIGEQPTRMGRPNYLKLLITMLTNKAVGE